MSASRSVSVATKWMGRNKQITSTSSSTRSIFSMFDKNNAGAKVVEAKKEESPIKKAAIPAVNTNVSSFNKKFSSTPTTETISKKDIVDAVAEMHELTNAKADRIVKQVFDMIAEVSTYVRFLYTVAIENSTNIRYKIPTSIEC